MDQQHGHAAGELIDLVYEELRRLAAGKMAQESPGDTLQSTALVHEAWLRLSADESRRFADRTHFFATAAEAMRRILIDRARRRQTERHGGNYERVLLDAEALMNPDNDEQFLALNDALGKMTAKHPQQASVVKLRYFAGMTNEEIGQVLGISASTVKNYWIFSKAWLFNEMSSK